jgi:Mn-dependent DtxR family transcriptional regulator
MDEGMESLSPTKEMYIKTVYELVKGGRGARVSDIAVKMGVAKPSVCTAIRELEEKRLVEKKRYRTVSLTRDGKRLAFSIQRRYTIIKRFLTETVGVTDSTAESDACLLEHIISAESLQAFDRHLKR